MKALLALGAIALSLGSVHAQADNNHDCPDCDPRTKDVCFNLVCNYEFDDHDRLGGGHDLKRCTVASTFEKAVTRDGGEVSDDSNPKNNPTLELTCDGQKLHADSARRSTSLLGTRIQGQQGPTPAVLLPRGVLHGGHDGNPSGGHYSRSVLELDLGRGFVRGQGKCFIWTGYP